MNTEMGPIMLRFLGIVFLTLLVMVVVLLGAAAGVYFYLGAEDEPPRLASSSTVRSISSGEIVGFEGEDGAHAWLGIPYARPPVGELRWQSPQPPQPWESQRQTLNYGARCIQLPAIPGSDEGRGVVGDEDCLTLNVWAPAYDPAAVPGSEGRLPVMFWIHGGGNSIGSGGSDAIQLYDGALMATRHKVILVTVNYRLGALGWFAHDALMAAATTPEDASGNFGTLDLIMALKWVGENIAVFGGDPSNVTIYGESAGGTNVLSLLASPLARGLFHGGIVQSGLLRINSMDVAQQIRKDETGNDRLSSRELVARWHVQAGASENREAAIAVQDEMPPAELAGWLRSQPADDLYAIFDSSFAGMIFMPMIYGDGHVMPKMTAAEVFTNPRHYAQVPIILGSNREETALFLGFSPDYMNYKWSLPVGIRDLEAYRRDVKYGSDLWRADGVDAYAEPISMHWPGDVFSYRFDADDWRHLGLVNLQDMLGAAHAMELFFVFGYFPEPMKIVFPESSFASLQALSDSMMSYWAEFAYTGRPGSGRQGKQPEWLPWRNESGMGHFNILDTDLDGGIRMDQGVIRRAEVEAAFMVDSSHASEVELCLSYRSIFFGDNFDQTTYASLGCQ